MYPTVCDAPLKAKLVAPLDAIVIVDVPIVKFGLVNDPVYAPDPVIVVDATPPAFVAVVVDVVYVAPTGATDTTVTD